MKFCGCLYVVNDAEKTKAFYKEVFGLRVIQDFNANFVMTGGISFQTKDSWKDFIQKTNDHIIYKGNDHELYFETEDLDEFVKLLDARNDIVYVHGIKEHAWGQRGLRFYDPDFHIIEVSEPLSAVVKRFYDQGMTFEEISKKTMLSIKMAQRLHKKAISDN